MNIDSLHWYAAHTMVNQEFRIKHFLEEADVESFLPSKMVLRQFSDRKKMIETPLIRGIVFVRTDSRTALSLLKERNMKARYMYDYANRSMLVIPDRQMQDFISLVNNAGADELTILNADFAPGDRVQVVEGTFAGLEGELVRIEGKNQVLIRVGRIAAVGVKIDKSQLIKIGK